MPSRETARRVSTWNRKLHNYVGLYLILFLWLFAVSGLILNHPTWSFAQFWPDREQSSYERQIRVPPAGGDAMRARDLLDQLGIAGEIEQITARAEADEPGLEVRVMRPGRIVDIRADFEAGRATVAVTQTNAWGVLHWLHSFTGVRMGRPEQQRDWVMTRLWSLAMDAVCAGLLFLVASSLYMWYPVVRKRKLGWAFLGAGLLGCGFFLFGLGWLA